MKPPLTTDLNTIFSSSDKLLYVKMSPERLTVRNVKNGTEVSDVPEAAVTTDDEPVVIAFGKNARAALTAKPTSVVDRLAPPRKLQIINPFAHPRTPISDFLVADVLLRALVAELLGRTWFSRGPIVVIHPIRTLEGGLTQIERRAIIELGASAGAYEVVICVGRELSDEELQSEDVLARLKKQQGTNNEPVATTSTLS
jgi:rod shape-determining protein MreB and related proteins